jgi:hypothetical protein
VSVSLIQQGLSGRAIPKRLHTQHLTLSLQNWDLSSSGDASEAKRFIDKLIWQTDRVMKVFSGLIMLWQDQSGISKTPIPSHDWFLEVESDYKPAMQYLFNAKST